MSTFWNNHTPPWSCPSKVILEFRLILSEAIQHGWSLSQLDSSVKAIFVRYPSLSHQSFPVRAWLQ